MKTEARVFETSQPVTTPGGRRRLDRRLEEARAAYFRACDENEAASGSGDTSVWHDNFAWEENQRQLHQLAYRVKEVERLVAAVQVAALPAGAVQRVRLGTVVSVGFVEDGTVQTWLVAGVEDGDPATGRVSYTSPLGRALVGRAPGDSVRIGAAGREREAEVLETRAATPAEDEEGLR